VLERQGDLIRFHPRILELAGHYHFAAKPVAIARGNEKGRVERLIRDLREAFFAARTRRRALRSPRRSAFAAMSVAHILDQRRRARGAPVPIDISLSSDPRVQNLVVTPHSLARYDRLGDADSAENQVKP
jgi:hypothetical protein